MDDLMESFKIDVESFPTEKLCIWYVCHSLLYYRYDKNVIPDATYDKICKILLDR